MKHHKIMWAEMRPFLYDGPKCDQVRPQWHCEAEGDMDSTEEESIDLDAAVFPPGTKIEISVPCCPKCTQIQECCDCGFAWDAWRDNEYS